MAAPNNNYMTDAAPVRPVGGHLAPSIATAVTFTPPATADKLLAQAVGGNVRFTIDGTVPTASSGFQLRDGDPPILIAVGEGTVIKAIGEDGSATLQVQWGR